MPVVYLGLGSNIGDREAQIARAAAALRAASGVRVLRGSSLYRTSAVGPRQRDFYNAVLKVRTSLRPRELLALLKGIERALGRTDGKRWGPRVIDIDILFYGDAIVREHDLQIPHPQIPCRRFVAEPMAELSPGYVHPALRVRMRSLAASLRETGGEQSVETVADVKKGEWWCK